MSLSSLQKSILGMATNDGAFNPLLKGKSPIMNVQGNLTQWDDLRTLISVIDDTAMETYLRDYAPKKLTYITELITSLQAQITSLQAKEVVLTAYIGA
jgi:hypothetical protein